MANKNYKQAVQTKPKKQPFARPTSVFNDIKKAALNLIKPLDTTGNSTVYDQEQNQQIPTLPNFTEGLISPVYAQETNQTQEIQDTAPRPTGNPVIDFINKLIYDWSGDPQAQDTNAENLRRRRGGEAPLTKEEEETIREQVRTGLTQGPRDYGPISVSGAMYGSSDTRLNYPYFRVGNTIKQIIFDNGIAYDIFGNVIPPEQLGPPFNPPNANEYSYPQNITFIRGYGFVDAKSKMPVSFKNPGVPYLSTSIGHIPLTPTSPENYTSDEAHKKIQEDVMKYYKRNLIFEDKNATPKSQELQTPIERFTAPSEKIPSRYGSQPNQQTELPNPDDIPGIIKYILGL